MSRNNLLTEVHLLVLVHGMWGHPQHLLRLSQVVKETHERSVETAGRELDVLVAETNRESHTYDGVDWGAERVVREVHQRVADTEAQNKKVTRFSILGYSLGGLLARYAVGILYSQGFFDKVIPINFATVATPNIGLLRYPTFISRLYSTLGPFFLSRTGTHFYATDAWEGIDAEEKKPLLEVMSEKGAVFYDGLAKFKHITVYANAINDRTVPFITAAIEPYDSFVAYERIGMEIDLDEKYAPVIKEYHLPEGVAPDYLAPMSIFSREYWVDWYNQPSNLPPFLQKPFPWNILVYLVLPLLLPLAFLAAVISFSFSVYHSQRRIQVLESTEGAGNRNTIMKFMRSIERGVEDAVVEFMEDDMIKQGEEVLGLQTETDGEESRSSTPMPGEEELPLIVTDDAGPLPVKHKVLPQHPRGENGTLRHRRRSSITYTPSSDPYSPYYSRRQPNPPLPPKSSSRKYPTSFANVGQTLKNQPELKPCQLRMLQNLNTLPNLKKEFVFLDNMRNSHATIVVRDPHRFDFHHRGEGVLRSFADSFEV